MSLLNRFFRPFGYELKKHYKIATPTAMDAIMNAINHYRTDLLLDVGANTGQFAKEIRSAGYHGELHSFEPVKKAYDLLETASQNDHKWHTHQLALGAVRGTQTMNVMATSDLSSFNTPSQFGKDRFKGFQSATQESVQVDTIDHFIESNKLQSRKILLKMDTQGHDLEVLKGAAFSLKYILAIQSEISFQPLYEEMPYYLESLKTIENCGYSVAALNPVAKSEDLSVIEMDCLFIRKKC
jgi:FkbM family methyltransferase